MRASRARKEQSFDERAHRRLRMSRGLHAFMDRATRSVQDWAKIKNYSKLPRVRSLMTSANRAATIVYFSFGPVVEIHGEFLHSPSVRSR